MEGRDFRSIGRPAQEELRRRALVLILQQGLSQAQAAEIVGVQRQTVNVWLQRYRAQGEDGVLDGRRVSPRRGKGLLTAEEAGKVQGWIADKTPDQLRLPFALWTSRAVRDLIALRFGKRLGLSTVQLYLQRLSTSSTSRRGIGPAGPMGMTPQKPLARARERQPGAIAAWPETAYPAIANRAKAEGASIYWGDETGITNQDQIGRSYAPRGQTPVIRTARRITQSMISAVSNRGLMRLMFYDGALNAAVDPRCGSTIAFLRRLSKDAGQKVFLIVDNLKVHHANKVKTLSALLTSRRGIGPEARWVAAHAHDRAVLPAGLRARPQPRRIFEQRPEAEAAPAAAAGLARRADQKHPRRAARDPALTAAHPGLLHTPARPLCRLNVRYNDGILVIAQMQVSQTGRATNRGCRGSVATGHLLSSGGVRQGFVELGWGAGFCPSRKRRRDRAKVFQRLALGSRPHRVLPSAGSSYRQLRRHAGCAWKWVPSTHMRCKITASLRASANKAA
jgi:transposase